MRKVRNPARTELYELMSTKFSERKAGMEV